MRYPDPKLPIKPGVVDNFKQRIFFHVIEMLEPYSLSAGLAIITATVDPSTRREFEDALFKVNQNFLKFIKEKNFNSIPVLNSLTQIPLMGVYDQLTLLEENKSSEDVLENKNNLLDLIGKTQQAVIVYKLIFNHLIDMEHDYAGGDYIKEISYFLEMIQEINATMLQFLKQANYPADALDKIIRFDNSLLEKKRQKIVCTIRYNKTHQIGLHPVKIHEIYANSAQALDNRQSPKKNQPPVGCIPVIRMEHEEKKPKVRRREDISQEAILRNDINNSTPSLISYWPDDYFLQVKDARDEKECELEVKSWKNSTMRVDRFTHHKALFNTGDVLAIRVAKKEWYLFLLVLNNNTGSEKYFVPRDTKLGELLYKEEYLNRPIEELRKKGRSGEQEGPLYYEIRKALAESSNEGADDIFQDTKFTKFSRDEQSLPYYWNQSYSYRNREGRMETTKAYIEAGESEVAHFYHLLLMLYNTRCEMKGTTEAVLQFGRGYKERDDDNKLIPILEAAHISRFSYLFFLYQLMGKTNAGSLIDYSQGLDNLNTTILKDALVINQSFDKLLNNTNIKELIYSEILLKVQSGIMTPEMGLEIYVMTIIGEVNSNLIKKHRNLALFNEYASSFKNGLLNCYDEESKKLKEYLIDQLLLISPADHQLSSTSNAHKEVMHRLCGAEAQKNLLLEIPLRYYIADEEEIVLEHYAKLEEVARVYHGKSYQETQEALQNIWLDFKELYIQNKNPPPQESRQSAPASPLRSPVAKSSTSRIIAAGRAGSPAAAKRRNDADSVIAEPIATAVGQDFVSSPVAFSEAETIVAQEKQRQRQHDDVQQQINKPAETARSPFSFFLSACGATGALATAGVALAVSAVVYRLTQ